ncbi:MAG: hypothetical protein Q7T48_11370, partial [Cellvibrio sp.]|uniref:hypothetical protein n=1 Tax=Cellvibrio sp. TaxID=1965322 RepID=UPI00271EF631|nr:hypothetical protein [Cellvibrio sp.]
MLGSPSARWANIYAATTTIGGTIVIDTDDIRATGILNITGAAASLWKTTSGNLTITAEAGNLIASGTDVRLIASTGDLSATSSNAIYFGTNNQERLRINSSGYVGIGTTTLAGLLTVGTSTPALVVSQNGNVILVQSSGSVGIGTAAPLTQLHLSGAGGAAALRFEETDGAVDEKNWIVRNYSGGFEVRSVSDANNNSKVIFNINRDGFNVDKIWFAEGNLGIGNKNPSSKLTVNGGDMVVSSAGSATTTISSGVSTFAGGFISQASSTFTGDLTVNSDAYASNSFFVDASTGQIGIGTTTLAGLFTVGTSTPALVVSPLSYVGIGTSTPSTNFAVAGNIMGSGNMVLYGTATSTIAGPVELASPFRTAGNIYPSDDVTYMLGSPSARWANIYAATTTIGGTIVIDTDDIRATGILNIT